MAPTILHPKTTPVTINPKKNIDADPTVHPTAGVIDGANPIGSAAMLTTLLLARRFGSCHGGNAPGQP